MKNKIKIGAHPWAYAAGLPGYDVYPILDQLFADFKRGGFDGIELMHTVFNHDDAVDKIAALSARYALPVIGTSWGGNTWKRDAEREVMASAEKTVAGLRKLGARENSLKTVLTLGTSTGSKPNEKKTAEELDVQAAVLRRIIQLGEANGVTLNLHNHTYEVKDNEYEVKAMIERIPDVKLGPDLNWLRRAGVDPLDFLRRNAKRIVFLHIRDQKGDKWVEALGEGDTDYRALARVLDEIDFKGEATIELAHERGTVFTRSMGDNFALSCMNLRKAFGL
jgi:sugar phosphate isomerase/epimerase